jgi:sugar lactone lactonase YvrE
MKSRSYSLIGFLVVILLVALACGQPEAEFVPDVVEVTAPTEVSEPDEVNAEEQEVEEESEESEESEEPEEPEEPESTLVTIRQWASAAEATSSYGTDSWSAEQAVGAPNTPDCGDTPTAWASSSGSEVETLTVFFDVPVFANEIHIYETYMPDQVVLVELIAMDGFSYEVYSAEPEDRWEDCPLVLSISFETTEFLVGGAYITIDESVLGLGWNEIDAVQLVGLGTEADLADVPPEVPVEGDFVVPDNFLWRISSNDDLAAEFAMLGGMDTDANGLLYVTDNIEGVFIFDQDGNQVGFNNFPEFRNSSDVKIAPNGNMVVSDWGSDEVFVFTSDGNFYSRFGGEGNDPGQFGTFSPDAVAVAPDNTIFVLDENEDDAGNEMVRVQKFTQEGEYLGEFLIEEEFFAASGMDFGPDGNLYVVGFIGGYILKFDTDGNLLGKLGEDTLDYAAPQRIAFDDAGNIYVSIWTEAGAVKLDPEGNFVERFGVEHDSDDSLWPEGATYMPDGIAVAPDGSVVYISDYGPYDAFITAFEVK